MAPDEPLPVVEVGPFEPGETQLFDDVEVVGPEDRLLEGAEDAPGASVALGDPDKGGDE